MLVPSSAYLLQPFILKLILIEALRKIYLAALLGVCGAVGDMCAGEHISVWVWLGYVCREACIMGEHISALQRYVN